MNASGASASRLPVVVHMGSNLSMDAAGGSAWVRFQDLLTTLKPGQQVTVNSLAARSGLEVESVETVLHALTRAELFVQLDAVTFVRERLKQRCA